MSTPQYMTYDPFVTTRKELACVCHIQDRAGFVSPDKYKNDQITRFPLPLAPDPEVDPMSWLRGCPCHECPLIDDPAKSNKQSDRRRKITRTRQFSIKIKIKITPIQTRPPGVTRSKFNKDRISETISCKQCF